LFVDIYAVFCRTLIQAGTTPEERDNFGRYLITSERSTHSQSAEEEEGMKHIDSEAAPFIGFGYDSFREIHGKDAEGAFTYWSTRARNRCKHVC
jgi:exonuclease III